MNGYEIKPETLKANLEFVREEIKRVEAARDKLAGLGNEARSDDADTLQRGYSRVLAELRGLLRHNYDVE